jgi:hypothetical protein
MYQTLMASITLWLFVIALGVNLGAGLYEARIVVPLWAGGVPGTLAEGDPFGRVAIDAGIRFWAYTTSATAILAILALVFGFHTPAAERAWRTFATIAELVTVATTLLYFRPTLVRLFMGHGAGMSDDAIRSAVHRWTAWNRVRIVVSFVAWCAALYALVLNHP